LTVEPSATPDPRGLRRREDSRAAGGQTISGAKPGRFACESCGAVLAFAPGTSQLKCAYCGHANRIAAALVEVVEHELTPALDRLGHDVPEPTPLHAKCPSCAADFDLAANLHAGPCPFCASPVVLDPGPPHRKVRPQALLPFMIGEPEAKRLVADWLRRLWFAPSGVTDQARGPSRLRGLYVPYWTFDSSTRTAYVGRRGDVYYVTQYVNRTVNGRSVREAVRVPRVRWTPARGRVARDFDDVLVLAGETLPRHLVERLEPWDLHGLKPYGHEYLAGFEGELYQVPVRQAFAEAQAVMREAIKEDVRHDIGGDQQVVDRMEVDFLEPSFKHVLLPVWVAAFNFLGKPYRFVVNGRTGEVHGERPWSAWKLALAGLLGLVAVLLLAWLFSSSPALQEMLRTYFQSY
jgi:LSD1 subclass zinc finger protein